jgi:hypothetical protein
VLCADRPVGQGRYTGRRALRGDLSGKAKVVRLCGTLVDDGAISVRGRRRIRLGLGALSEECEQSIQHTHGANSVSPAASRETSAGIIAAMPPIDELTRIEPNHLARLQAQGTFTTGLLLERSETVTRRQYLADQVDATPNDILDWRDEALMLNLASFGPDDHQLLIQAGIEGLRGILALSLDDFTERIHRAARELNLPPPSDLTISGWWEQAKTLEEE